MEKTRRIPFMKMHGAGNDFVFLTREETDVVITKKLATQLLDRHFGIGGDQLLVLEPGTSVSLPELKFYNADGSTAEMCGNGARAVGFYLRQFKGFRQDFDMKTKSKTIKVHFEGNTIEINMGRPILEGPKIPTRGKGEIINHPLKVGGKTYKIHAVSMGNPHCVIYVNNVKKFPVCQVGPLIEHHPFFPKRVNVEFVEVLKPGQVRVRVWERGAGETLACGSGACAVAVAGNRIKKTSPKINMDFPGGRLRARILGSGEVFLTGPAAVTYSGTFLV